MNLELRHLWTATGEPVSWRFDGEDEHELRDLLKRLDQYRADPTKRSAVLIATDDDGKIMGAWNRQGAAELKELIQIVPRTSEWLEVRHALLDAVTGP